MHAMGVTARQRYAISHLGVPGRVAWIMRSAAIAASVILPLSCTTHAPTIQFDGATVRDRTPDAVLVDFSLTLNNDNTSEVVLGEFFYSVDAPDGFTGRRRALVTLAPLSSDTITLPAVLLRPGQGEALDLESLNVDGEIEWRGTTDIERAFYDSGLYRPRAAFAGQISPK